MVSSFTNTVFRTMPRKHRISSQLRNSSFMRALRSHWILEPLIMCGVICVLVSGAKAADLGSPDAPVYDTYTAPGSIWAGGYAGVETGVSQTTTDVKSGGRKKDVSRVDAAFGLFGGYNWEVSRFILGVEAGAAYLGGKKKAQHPTLGQIEAGSRWTVNAKARAGLPFDNIMPYLSVGLAASDHTLKANGKTKSSVQIQPVLGGGLEVAVTDAWRVRADYSLTGLVSSKENFNGTRVERNGANHRLMLGISRAF